MIERPFWLQRINEAWKTVPIVWLAGVRRVGKTVLAQSLGKNRILYLNCDLPTTADMVSNPELFYRNCDRSVIVFDEVHQLNDPSRVLKIGADLFPHLKILATGSSTLAASTRFRDTLTGRKRLVHLTPVLWDELQAFGDIPLLKRLHKGGLPQALLAEDKRLSSTENGWIPSLRETSKSFLTSANRVNSTHSLNTFLNRVGECLRSHERPARSGSADPRSRAICTPWKPRTR